MYIYQIKKKKTVYVQNEHNFWFSFKQERIKISRQSGVEQAQGMNK